MKNLVSYLKESANQCPLKETPELIDLLKNINYNKAGLHLNDVHEEIAKRFQVTKGAFKDLNEFNKFRLKRNTTYMVATQAEGTADFLNYVTEKGLLDKFPGGLNCNFDAIQVGAANSDNVFYEYAWMTDNIFIIYIASGVGDDNSILVVSDTF